MTGKYKYIAARAVCLLAAASMCLTTGCSDGDNSSSSKAQTDKTNSSETLSSDTQSDKDNEKNESSAASEADSAESAPDTPEKYIPGPLLAKSAEAFGEEYLYSVEISYSDSEGKTLVTQAKKDGSFCQKTSEEGSEGLNADNVYCFDGENGYYADYNIKAYTSCGQLSGLELLPFIIENELEQTSTHIPKDTGDFTVEEYTYAGDTYMTVYDFYFAEGNDIFEKYTVTYSVEGQDDVIQTVEVTDFASSAADIDEYALTQSDLDALTDFDNISEDTRLGYCQGVCASFNISTDEMYSMDITTDDLKRINFDTFTDLVYMYAKI